MRRMQLIVMCIFQVNVMLIAGCGGGSGGSKSQLALSGTGYLGNSDDTVYASGLYMDQVGFTATRTGLIRVTMSKSGGDTVDPKVFVVKNDADYTLIGSDDDSGEGLNASYTFSAVAGQSYYAWFSTAYKYDSGAYSYTITEVDSSLSAGIIELKDNAKSQSNKESIYEDLKQITN